MRKKCEYCGIEYDDTLSTCPHCSAPNPHVRTTANGVPKTIEELKQWYVEHHLPPEETTRFFIGKDYKGKRAFGIYQDPVTGNFVVYKNKDDGSRAIRYEGTDEDYAVNELYIKLKDEIAKRQSPKPARTYGGGNIAYRNRYVSKKKTAKQQLDFVVSFFLLLAQIVCGGLLLNEGMFAGDVGTDWFIAFLFFGWMFLVWVYIYISKLIEKRKSRYTCGNPHFILIPVVILLAVTIGILVAGSRTHENGYYVIDDTTYYHLGGGWYEYDDLIDDWWYVDAPYVDDDVDDYYEGYSYYGSYADDDDFQYFEDTSYYDNYHSSYSSSSSSSSYDDWSSSSWDSSYDWDSGSSWDSGGSDWGSDW